MASDEGRPPGPGTTSRDAAEIAWDTAQARLGRQGARLAELRTNSSVLLAASALVATFLGEASLGGAQPTGWGWAAIVCFVLGILAGIRPLWPVRDRAAATAGDRLLSAVPLLGDWLAQKSGVQLVWRSNLPLAEIAGQAAEERFASAHKLMIYADENQRLIARRARWIMWASLFLFAQALAWTLDLIA